jgi:catechol 2,3-dioxygenase-like lactoylglutathione lyase family enzyme
MLSYVMVGANDIPRSERFYTAVLQPLGYEKAEQKDTVVYTLAGTPNGFNGPRQVYVKKPFDGHEATVGNGSMLAFEVSTQAGVHELHRAGIAAGGSDEGAPGYRAIYSDRFYVAYLRDPLGNKLALFCTAVSRAG